MWPAWTLKNRALFVRNGVSYPRDLGDAEWTLIASMVPPARRGSQRREVDKREEPNGALYVLEAGGRWCASPKDLWPKCTTMSCCGVRTVGWSVSMLRLIS